MHACQLACVKYQSNCARHGSCAGSLDMHYLTVLQQLTLCLRPKLARMAHEMTLVQLCNDRHAWGPCVQQVLAACGCQEAVDQGAAGDRGARARNARPR